VTPRTDDPRALIRYALVGLALTVALLWALYLVREALLLIYVAALVAIGLAPLVATVERVRLRRRRRRAQLPRWAAILAIYLAVIGIVTGIAALIVPPLLDQAQAFRSELPMMIERGQQWLLDRGLLPQRLTLSDALEQSPVAGGDVVRTVVDTLWRFLGGLVGILTILILAFYFLVDSDGLVRTFLRLFPARERGRAADACDRIATKVSAWLAGQLLLGAIIGATAALGLWLLGVPYFYVLALIAGVGEMIPVVGPLLAAIPAIAVALSVSPSTALFVALFFLAQQQVENHVLVPKIMERQVGVSAVVVIVALLVGGTLLGVVGAILAVPTAAILQVVFEDLVPEAASEE
jgi:predicted PurR-regulated permease PerM